jgi:hypothetical protein
MNAKPKQKKAARHLCCTAFISSERRDLNPRPDYPNREGVLVKPLSVVVVEVYVRIVPSILRQLTSTLLV